MRRCDLAALSAALLVAVTTSLACAQPHGLGYIAASHSGMLLVVDPMRATRSIVIGQNTIFGLTMDADNRAVVACQYGDEVLRVDPISGTVIGTVFKGPPLQGVCDVVVDQNGDYYVTDAVLNGVLRIARDGGIQTVRLDPVRMDHPYGGLAIDAYTGDLLLLDVAHDDALLQVTRDGSRLTTLATGFAGRHGIGQHIPSGTVYAGGGGGNEASVYRWRPRRTQAEVFLQDPGMGMLAVKVDRSSAREQQLIGTGSGRLGGIWVIDQVTAVPASFTLFGQDAYEVDFFRGRNLQTIRTGRGLWDIRLSFPEAPASSFVLLASLRGLQPAQLIPDGRALHLGPDPLFFLTLTGSLPPFLTGNHGGLDLLGEGKARLDLRSVDPHANGTRVWFAALVLDPAAPSGIRILSDPFVFVIEGL